MMFSFHREYSSISITGLLLNVYDRGLEVNIKHFQTNHRILPLFFSLIIGCQLKTLGGSQNNQYLRPFINNELLSR